MTMVVDSKIDLGGEIAPVRARINRRARRYIVRVDSVSGTVLITAPSKRDVPAALRFAKSRADWIKSELRSGPKAYRFEAGGICPYRGEDHLIINQGAPRGRVRIVSTHQDQFQGEADQNHPHQNQLPELHVGGEGAHVNRRIIDWLKREARTILSEKSDYYAERLGVKRGKIRIGDTRSRWGSCSADGCLSYSWRLILAPKEILDYVAAHECTHLIHLNHSPDYWRLLATLDVDARGARRWFRNHGERLFAYGETNGRSGLTH